jgi:hypothetical protein
MSGYLQRLYDAGAVPADSVSLRPAQRSHSPLIAADQRLARPEFAANFGFGATPDVEGDAYAPLDAPDIGEAAPATREVPRREEPLQARADEGFLDFLVQPIVTRSEAPQLPTREVSTAPQAPPAVIERMVHETRAFAPPVPAAVPVLTPPASGTKAQTALARAQPLPQTPTPAERRVPPSPLPPITVRETVRTIVAPPRPQDAPLAEPLHEPPPPQPLPLKFPALAPQPARPAARVAPEPLPPVLPESDWPAIEARMRALIRSEREAVAVPTSRVEIAADPEHAETAPQPRPLTAESVSVIGPIGRPARHMMLFGTRLR